MALCSNCGKDNREAARFCQSCGTPLTPTVPKTQTGGQQRVKKSTSEIASGATCTSCGTLNAPGMRFCKMCGSPVESPKGQPAKVSCPSCGGDTPTGYKFCQHCGTPLTSVPVTQPEPVSASGDVLVVPSASPVATGVVPRTVVPTRAPGGPPPIAPQPDLAKTLIEMDRELPVSSVSSAAAVAPAGTGPQMQPTPSHAAVSGAIQSSAATPGAGSSAPAVVVTPQSAAMERVSEVPRATMGPGAKRVAEEDVVQHARVPLARLVSVNRDGSDGELHHILEESVDLGRNLGQLRFADDPYLSDRHCRFYIKNGSWIVQDLESINGVFLRIRSPRELEHGDYLLLGKQVLRFEYLSEQERDITPAVEHGVLIFGSPLRTPWCRLRQFTVAGIARDVYHLYRAKVTVGREEGDIIFPDDEFMSRRHLVCSMVDGTAEVEDLGSSNGTYLRIRDRVDLTPGDMIRIGDQLLRFEKA